MRGQRTPTEALLTLDGIVSGTAVEGSMTTVLFLEYLEFNVVSQPKDLFLHCHDNTLQFPKCTAYPGPLSVVVMDNAKIHHSDGILKLADRFGGLFTFFFTVYFHTPVLGVRIEYLPPYSPDLNPIEEAFSKIKHYLRHHHEYCSMTNGDGILYDMLEVLDIITPDDAVGYFAHAGYF